MVAINRHSSAGRSITEALGSRQGNCIFLSHSSVDKPAVRKIGQYIVKKGIDIYFDERDARLQSAQEPSEIVDCIHDGLKHSTHTLCVLSPATLTSQWVPYEIGYAAQMDHPLAIALLKSVDEVPQFYKISEVLPDIWDLDNYLRKVGQTMYLAEGSTSGTHYLLNDIMQSYRSVKYGTSA